ncbi:MAG TPA: universal stress protein [Dehalococcoidia bacterium]|nr:universal stress protein [Dehalococcoidia bacterium]
MPSLDRSDRVLVPVVNTDGLRQFLNFSHGTLADFSEVVLLGVILSSGDAGQDAHRARNFRRRLRQSIREVATGNSRIVVRSAQTISQAVRASILDEQPDLVLLPWTSAQDGLDELATRPFCNTAFVRPAGGGQTSRVLLAARGGPQAELAMEIALRLAKTARAELTVMHIDRPSADNEARDRERRLFRSLVARCRRRIPAKQRTLTGDDIAEAIVKEASHHDVLVLGAGLARGAEPALGALADGIAHQAGCTTIVVKTGTPVDPAFFAGANTPIDVIVDRWFADNTFHCREFGDLDSLIAAKQRSGMTISLAVMARENRQALPGIIDTVTAELVDRNRFLDEIVVFDQEGSVLQPPFDLVKRPAGNGAIPVLPADGLALWKSVNHLQGEIIAWVDGDLRNIHSRMVYGVVGPLLTQSRLHYVKGFYQQPAGADDASFSQGRTQLTELTARPLLNLFFPELSGVVAPLTREHAIRRSAIEGLRLFAGPGVEIGLLIDVFQRFGLRAIAQSDLESRVGEDLSVAVLSEQAFSVAQVILQRLGKGDPSRFEVERQTMKLILQEDERYRLQVVQTADRQLPKLSTSGRSHAID